MLGGVQGVRVDVRQHQLPQVAQGDAFDRYKAFFYYIFIYINNRIVSKDYSQVTVNLLIFGISSLSFSLSGVAI